MVSAQKFFGKLFLNFISKKSCAVEIRHHLIKIINSKNFMAAKKKAKKAAPKKKVAAKKKRA